MTRRLAVPLLIALLAAIAPATAATFRWAGAYDVASLDPYTRQESFQLAFLGNIYEPLIRRGRHLELEPALAVQWRQVAPLVWRFDLRQGVRFQGGAPFTAADVVFSYRRATAPGSAIASALAAIREVRAVDAQTVDIVTTTPDPALPEEIVPWNIMSAAWCAAHGATAPADPAIAGDDFVAHHADGTGPFMIATRVPGQDTVFVANPTWWDKPAPALDRAVFRPIADDATRVAALTSGAVDLIAAVPLEDVGRLGQTPGVRVARTPGTRTIFLGFDQTQAAVRRGKRNEHNPLADRRVRQAFAQAIDEGAIAATVMRGFAAPAGLLVGPGVRGFDPALNGRPAYDPGSARRLLAAAGYADGFDLTMDCPDDRYINDAAICRAVVADLAKIGVRVALRTQSRARFFARLLDPGRGARFYLMGWRPADDDAIDALINLAATRNDKLHTGAYNFGGYANPAVDGLIARAERRSVGFGRGALLRAALATVKADDAYIPLHQPDVVWAMRDDIEVVPRGDDRLLLRDVRMK